MNAAEAQLEVASHLAEALQRIIFIQQISHRALFKPLPM